MKLKTTCVLLFCAVFLWAGAGCVRADAEAEKGFGDIIVHTLVEVSGQRVESIDVKLSEPLSGDVVSALKPEDFLMSGKAAGWMQPQPHAFEAPVAGLDVTDTLLTLYFEDFPEKYFYVTDFTVECSAVPELTFSKADITEALTPVADDFEDGTFPETAYAYHLFTPAAHKENTEASALPVVVVFHGYGDTDNLLTYRTSVEWAEAENQAVRPCYVLSPVIVNYSSVLERTQIYDAIYEMLQEMMAAGKVDAERVYVMGNSFGGAATIEFLERFPDFSAGALILCPALNYFDASVFKNLSAITEIPMWFCHAENDLTIASGTSRTAVEILEKNGAEDCHLTIYADEEMDAAGAVPSPEASVSYHHVEAAVMPDSTYAEWLFSCRLSGDTDADGAE